MFNLQRGDIQRLSDLSKVPHETVRRYVNGGNINVIAAKAIDAAYTKLKPAQSRRQRARNAATGRRVGAAKAGAANTSASRHSNSTSAAEE
jgi:hypothetical protein